MVAPAPACLITLLSARPGFLARPLGIRPRPSPSRIGPVEASACMLRPISSQAASQAASRLAVRLLSRRAEGMPRSTSSTSIWGWCFHGGGSPPSPPHATLRGRTIEARQPSAVYEALG